VTRPTGVLSLPTPGRLRDLLSARREAPALDIGAVRAVLERYGLDLVGEVRNLTINSRNRSMVVATSRGKKVLKAYRPDWRLAAIQYEHSILQRLAQVGFPVPRLEKTTGGETLVQAGWQYCALFEFVDGTSHGSHYLLPAQRAKLLAVSGRLLARFHRDLEGFLPAGGHHLGFTAYEGERPRDLEWHLRKLDDLREKSHQAAMPADQLSVELLASRSEDIRHRLLRLEQVLGRLDLRRLIIHGDFGLHNLLFRRDGTVTLVDLELARLEWRLSDVVIVLSRLNRQSRVAFMKAYHAEYPLSAQEWHFLPEVWQLQMLQGAVQYWNNYYELGGSRRLAGACRRLEQANWASRNRIEFLKLRYSAARRPEEKPLRVWMVPRLFHPWVGGAERQAHKLAQKLIDKNVCAEIVTGWWFRGTPQREILDGVPVFRNLTLWECFGIKGLRKLGGYLYILTLIWHLGHHRADFDVLHVSGLNYHTFAVVLARRWHKRKVLVKLANSGPASDIGKMRENRQLALSRFMLPTALQCDRFVALNKAIVTELQQAGVPAGKIIELGNGVETSGIPVKPSYELHDPVRLVFVGRLHEQKGLDVLLGAFQALLRRCPRRELRLQLLGEGPLRAELGRMADLLGISRQVEFAGHVDRVIDSLIESDIFILPSRAEGISNALLEAMACGLPVVASDIPGNHDVVEHGRDGLLFTVGDAADLATHVAALLKHGPLRHILGVAARQTVERRFSLDAITERYIDLYYDCLDASGRETAVPIWSEDPQRSDGVVNS